jgi:hypothetical protein
MIRTVRGASYSSRRVRTTYPAATIPISPADANVSRHSQPTPGATSERTDIAPGRRKCNDTA